ncbi:MULTISPECIES: FAD-binding oxidoreductase [unclassified Ruegeria]|uniref:NAD(P)/FAD-dependent oxidoreductase n=1 Tax=unclassified Ruegeria TaxID=2625375 RepID=UPI001ADC7672|nr:MULTISPECIES: FAD-binding oxidoreductase [unclassified Ruegeria]MBO9411332.1 FAD-binding oxidoreductase [Ruegeria sp. R8_1]MBO9416106.1 FAD-binding oxidoreductase [Ruegeria sp. R8_2]
MSSYTARSLPLHRGPAAWSVLLGDPPPARELSDNITADFTIIGAGFAGLSAARRLTQLQPDAKIVLLEAGRVAEGAAGRNSGFMIDLPHDLASDDYAGAGDDRAMIALNRQAIGFAREAVAQYQIDPNYFDPAGKVNGAASAAGHAHNESYAQHLANLGETGEMLDPQQMHELTGSRHYRSGLYTPGTVMLQPAGYVRGLAAGLVGDGVALFENSAVTGFAKQDNAWQVQTAYGSVSTGTVILTVNGHLESFGIETDRLMQLFLFAAMTPELDAEQMTHIGGQSRWGVTPSDPMGTTMRRIDSGQGGNRIITRTCAALRPGMAVTARDLNRAGRVMQRKFDQRFPQLAGLQMQYQWAGHLCLSLNGVSVARQIEPGVFSGCVQNGLGTARGTLTGIAAAERACGHQSDITRHFDEEQPPKRLPPQPFRELGANTLLRWKEWRARDE